MNNIRSVLIVEDSVTQREYLSFMLQQMGIEQVHQTTNGFEALQWLETQAESIDILFCDLSMPVMDGVTMLQEIATRGYKCGVVILSGREPNVMSAVAKMTQISGMNFLGTIAKPFQHENISQVLSTYNRDNKSQTKKFSAPSQTYTFDEIAEGIRQKQMICHFQPKVSMLSGKLIGVESLVRWQHPLHGLVYPGAFIPLIESTPLIQELTMCVLDDSIKSLHYWKENGIGLDISVNINVSADALSNSDFAQSMADRVALHNISADCFVLEVTESAIIRNLAQSLATVAKLRLAGFGLSIDDYGTGYSSMQQIAQLPFTELKLDRSLVHGIANSSTLHTLCESAVHMSHKLGLMVVAEGIETKEDFEMLGKMGCDIGQGYYIAKPMPANTILNWRNSNLIRARDELSPA